MNILILGATGRVGSHIVTHALQDGHHVTVLVRTPEKVHPLHANLTIIEGNVLNQDDVARAVQGNDVVISALNTDGTTTLSDSMPFYHRSHVWGGDRAHYNRRNCGCSPK